MEEHEKFHFPDNSSVESVDGLRDKIETISYDVFYHHVSDGKNDFAEWIRHVLKDNKLADDLARATSIVETVEVLNDYLQPGSAQKHLDAQDDMQSRIERDVLAIKEFENGDSQPSDAPPAVEDSASHDWSADVQEDTFEQEASESQEDEQRRDTEENAALDAPAMQELAQEEAQVSQHYKREGEEKKELSQFHHDVGTLIVKDFIWGFIFGLIVGVFLMKLFGL